MLDINYFLSKYLMKFTYLFIQGSVSWSDN